MSESSKLDWTVTLRPEDCGWCKDGWPVFEYQGKRRHSVPGPIDEVPCDYQEKES